MYCNRRSSISAVTFAALHEAEQCVEQTNMVNLIRRVALCPMLVSDDTANWVGFWSCFL